MNARLLGLDEEAHLCASGVVLACQNFLASRARYGLDRRHGAIAYMRLDCTNVAATCVSRIMAESSESREIGCCWSRV